ncbi:hemagglutinin [Bifidobacterium moraviense]|nr:hemagglutinin [Bifidobacterium sp. DSM 109958]
MTNNRNRNRSKSARPNGRAGTEKPRTQTTPGTRRRAFRIPRLSRLSLLSHPIRSWRNGGTAGRALTAGTALLAAVLVTALVLALVRVVRYQRIAAAARAQQQELTVEYDFDPGNIISDAQFFDEDAMSVDEVQDFLDDKGSACFGDQCLRSRTFDVPASDADGLCDAIAAAGARTAAQVIDTAAHACGISQKVLLTLMQKEQHLVTANPPTDWNYQAAMGLSCPDDADCDPQYAGFVNQVIGSARRFRYYLSHRQQYRFRTGRVNAIQYHPNTACGTGNVFIENDATTLLYIYTPYQPNAAALRAGTGTGDSCSSYGNRNFAIIYTSWFGDPRL